VRGGREKRRERVSNKGRKSERWGKEGREKKAHLTLEPQSSSDVKVLLYK
jgi:hypothetical protein